MSDESRGVGRYFSEWAEDYDRASEGTALRGLGLQHVINRLFRRRTFRERLEQLKDLLAGFDVAGKQVVDAGCGTGQLALWLAERGAYVTGLDISPAMLGVCEVKARDAGVAGRSTFICRDLTADEVPGADIVMCIAVLEYYRDPTPILRKLAAASRQTLVVCDARPIWWVVALRALLSLVTRLKVYYHHPALVRRAVIESGLHLREERRGSTFTTFVFERAGHGSG